MANDAARSSTPSPSAGARAAVLVYGVVSYVLFLGVFLYAIGFVGGVFVPRHIDDAVAAPPGEALLVDLALLSAFALQHSIMSRRWFKARWTRVVPASIERSTYVMLTNVVLALLFWQWRPLPEVVWSVEGALATVMWALFALGWLTVLVSTFLIDHFDLFGLRQVVLHWRGVPYTPPPFRERSLYRVVRHPLLLGFVIAFWATPHMTQGHLLFAAVSTAYMLVAIRLEERDLVAAHGEDYEDYRRRVSMILPGRPRPRTEH